MIRDGAQITLWPVLSMTPQRSGKLSFWATNSPLGRALSQSGGVPRSFWRSRVRMMSIGRRQPRGSLTDTNYSFRSRMYHEPAPDRTMQPCLIEMHSDVWDPPAGVVFPFMRLRAAQSAGWIIVIFMERKELVHDIGETMGKTSDTARKVDIPMDSRVRYLCVKISAKCNSALLKTDFACHSSDANACETS